MPPDNSNQKAKKSYRHGASLSRFQNCPGSGIPFGEKCFHAVHDDLRPECFQPRAIRNPAKKPRCAEWGISMFETERQLIEFFKRLQNHITNVREVLGDQVAEFHLT